MAAKDHISDTQFHLHLFHATASENVDYIKAQGLISPYLTNDWELAEHYALLQSDSRGGGFEVPSSIITVRANPRNLVPDNNSFEDPVHTYQSRNFDKTQLRDNSDWKNSLKQTGSVLHMGKIAPHNILEITPYAGHKLH
jgi:hypothetical protein